MKHEGKVVAAIAAGLGGLMLMRELMRGAPIELQGKVALITGGSRGLGLILARELSQQGVRLALVARSPAELESARHELETGGAEVLTIVQDISDPEAAAVIVQHVVDRFGRLDILINNAGVIQVGPLANQELKDFEDAVAIHFWAPLRLIMEALPHLKQSGEGRIVNISSVGGMVAIPHLGPYSASKFALTGLSDSFRAELAKDGIAVTTVCPGLIRTGSHLQALFKGQHQKEFAWFSISNALPLFSVDAHTAAEQIMGALRRGDPSLVMTPQARALVAANSIAPDMVARAMQVVNRLLPAPAKIGGEDLKKGAECGSSSAPSAVTSLADQAAFRNNELAAVR